MSEQIAVVTSQELREFQELLNSLFSRLTQTMKLSLRSISILSALSALVIAPAVLTAGSASAAPVRNDRSYVGAGLSGGVLRGDANNEDRSFGGNVQGRFAMPSAPVSVRGSVLFTGKNSAIVPTLTYDLPLNNRTNLYAGAGYSFVQNHDRTSQLGNRNAPVLTAGVESRVANGVVLYSDLKYGINAYESNRAGALAIQGGVGFEF
jgi:hypothetical protein